MPSAPVILVVEDEALVRWLVVDMFVEAGYDVLEACDGDEALTVLAARQDIRGLFTDIHMPGGMDGLALAHHVRSTRPDCAIVLASGRGLPQETVLPPNARYVPKPYRGEKVVEILRGLLS